MTTQEKEKEPLLPDSNYSDFPVKILETTYTNKLISLSCLFILILIGIVLMYDTRRELEREKLEDLEKLEEGNFNFTNNNDN